MLLQTSADFIAGRCAPDCRYIGGWPSGDERLPVPDCAVLDCIQELPKHVTTKHYLTVPVWDTFGGVHPDMDRRETYT